MPYGAERIAVLGAGGFIGSHLVAALLDRTEASVVAVDVTFDKLEARGERLSLVRASIDRPGLLDEITSLCDVVVSLTALCNPSFYNTLPLAVIDASYTDLVPLVKLCAEKRRALVHFSTCEVYGRAALDGAGGRLPAMNEDEAALVLGPVHLERWSYACAKQLLERVIWAHGRHHGLSFTIIRPFNTIGPRMDYLPGIDGEGLPRVLAAFMGALLRGEPLRLADGGGQRRSFLWVGDLVEAVLRVLARPNACRGEILNLGNPRNDITIRDLAERLRASYGALCPGAPVPPAVAVPASAIYGQGYDDVQERVPDVAKARRLLAWDPAITLDEMLPWIVADYLGRYGVRAAAGAA